MVGRPRRRSGTHVVRERIPYRYALVICSFFKENLPNWVPYRSLTACSLCFCFWLSSLPRRARLSVRHRRPSCCVGKASHECRSLLFRILTPAIIEAAARTDSYRSGRGVSCVHSSWPCVVCRFAKELLLPGARDGIYSIHSVQQ